MTMFLVNNETEILFDVAFKVPQLLALSHMSVLECNLIE